MRRGLKPHLFKGAYAALKGRSFTAVYTFVCFSAACKADVKNEPGYRSAEAMRYPKSCRKKETGRLGPASGASVEMRLHRSLAPLNQEIVRAQFTSAGASRASQNSQGARQAWTEEQLWGQLQIPCNGFKYFCK